MSFPRYPRYKDSGVQWLGDVPEHWRCAPIKYLVSLKGRLGWQGLRADEYSEEGPFLVTSEHFTNDQIDWPRCYHVSHDRYEIAPEIQLRPADLLMMKDGAAMGKLAYVPQLPGPACLNSHLLLFRPRTEDLTNRYLYYLLGSPIFKTYMVQERTGTTFFGISQQSIGRFSVTVPSRVELDEVVVFLDRETAKIDELVGEQRRLIELLKEKRQAVISHAITKGLNAHAPMKPSNIEWLGDVPEHWDCASLTRISERIVVGIAEAATHAYADEGIPILRSTNIRAGRIIGDIFFVDPVFAGDRESKRLTAGDLVTVRTGNAGVTALIPKEFDGCQCFTMLITTLNKQSVGAYYCYWMNSVSAQCYFSLEGWGTAQINISVPILKTLPIPIPPRTEQKAIVDYLNAEVARFDALTAEAERAIDLLQERRTALISAAVTGKIDVRGTTANHRAMLQEALVHR